MGSHIELIAGLILRAQQRSGSTRDHKCLAQNVTVDDNITSNGVNGTKLNGSASNLYFRNLSILDSFNDEYGGVVVDPTSLPQNPSAFAPILRLSLSHWKRMVTKILYPFAKKLLLLLAHSTMHVLLLKSEALAYFGQSIRLTYRFLKIAGKEGSLA